MRTMHPRPNPIIASLYTLRDLEIDVAVIHGPAGCGFMASRMIEEAGVRVVSSSIKDNDLIFGASEQLIRTLKEVKERFNPRTVAVVGTCASMIIGEDMDAAIKRADIGCTVFSVDCHGCMGDNTVGAVKTIEAASKASLISPQETERQITLLKEATRLERSIGMAGKDYLQPVRGTTKLGAAQKIKDALQNGKKVAVVMIAKKELAYRFADIFLAVDEAQKKLGGLTLFVANLNVNIGLPRIRRYAEEITKELASKNVSVITESGLDEYAFAGDRISPKVNEFKPDLLIVAGIPHFYGKLNENDILITDQPRQLANYLAQGHKYAVGEISSHSMVMNVNSIISLETADTLRELIQ